MATHKKPSKKKFHLGRNQKMDIVLEPLSGKQRSDMAAILQTVPTSLLQTTYDLFLDNVQKGKK